MAKYDSIRKEIARMKKVQKANDYVPSVMFVSCNAVDMNIKCSVGYIAGDLKTPKSASRTYLIDSIDKAERFDTEFIEGMNQSYERYRQPVVIFRGLEDLED